MKNNSCFLNDRKSDPKKSPSSGTSSPTARRAQQELVMVEYAPSSLTGHPPGHRRVPVLPVLAFVFAYIMAGAALFSLLEGWTFLEGAYFSFITLTTIGFGDYVPGDSILSQGKEDGPGPGMLILVCFYVLMGLAVVAMSINLVQEEIIAKFRDLAREMGILEEEEVLVEGGGSVAEENVSA